MGLTDSFESFVDWADENGIPLRTVTDFFESHGIPGMAGLSLIIVAILLVISFLVLPLFGGAVGGNPVLVSVITEGQPLNGADVLLSVPDKNIYKHGLTDAQGKVQFDGIPGGDTTLSVQKAGFAPYSDTLTVSGSTTQSVNLNPETKKKVTLTVQLKDSGDGQPVDGKVSLLGADGSTVAESDAKAGVAEFQVDANTNYRIRTNAAGFSDDERSKPVSDTDTFINIQLSSAIAKNTAKVIASVSDSKGNPLPNIRVELIDEATEQVIGKDYTGASGSMKADVQTGLTIHALATDESDKYLQGKSSSVKIDSTGDQQLSVILNEKTSQNSDLASFTIKSKTSGQPISGALVKVYKAGTKLSEQKSGSDGSVKLTLANGNYFVTFYATAFLPAQIAYSTGNQVIELIPSSVDNSGKLTVSVLDLDTNTVSGALVQLFTSDGNPIGLPDINTENDGSTTLISDLPSSPIKVKANYKGLEGETAATINTGETNTVEVKLQAASATAKAVVKNGKTGQALVNSLVMFKSSSDQTVLGNCTTDSTGSCSASIRAFRQLVYAQASASGFSGLNSAPQSAVSNTTLTFALSLTPGVDSNILQAQFKQITDSKRQKVLSITPTEDYSTTFSVSSPTNTLISGIQVRVGEEGSVLNDPAIITGFSASGYTRLASGSVYSGNFESDSNSTPMRGAYKWVQYEFAGSGSHDVKINLRALPSATPGSSISLYYRAYAIDKNNAITRSPADSSATNVFDVNSTGMDYGAIFARQSFNVTASQLECFETFCLSLNVPKEIARNSQFALGFDIRGNTNGTKFIIETDSPSLRLDGWSVSAPSQRSGSATTSGSMQKIEIPGTSGFLFKGSVDLTALRYDKAATLHVKYGEVDKEYTISVTGKGTFIVTASPDKLSAPSDSQELKVEVRDDQNAPVTNALVKLENAKRSPLSQNEEILGNGDTNFGRNGVYSFVDLHIKGPGQINMIVSADGFEDFTKIIDSKVTKLIDVSSGTINVQLNDNDKTVSIGLRNLLNEKVKVELSAKGSGEFTSFALGNSTVTLAPGESRNVDLTVARKFTFIPVASGTTNVRNETINGSVSVVASIADARQRETIAVNAQNTITIKNLDELWNATDSVNIELSDLNNDTLSGSDFITINSAVAGSTLVVNSKLTGDFAKYVKNIQVDPTSAEVPGQSSAIVSLTASLPDVFKDDLQCIKQEQTLTGNLELIGSIGNAVSHKNVTVSLLLKPSGSCAAGWGINETAADFTLSDLQKSASFTLSMFNHAKKNLEVSASVSGDLAKYVDPQSGIRFKLIYGNVQSATIAPGEDAIPFEIIATIPQDTLDVHNCVKDNSIDGNVTFTASASGYNATQEFPVTLTTQASDSCAWRIAQVQGEVFNSFFVNFATDLQQRFDFKAPGHFRYLSIVNNFDQPVTITSDYDASVVTCNLPSALVSGDSFVSTCTSTGAGSTTISLKAIGRNDVVLAQKSVTTTVYDPSTSNIGSIYTASPLGRVSFTLANSEQVNIERVKNFRKSVASMEDFGSTISFATAQNPTNTTFVSNDALTTGQLSVIDCSVNFCNSNQAFTAFTDSVLQYLAIVKKIKDSGSLASVNEYCSATDTPNLDKSIVVQLANTQIVGDFLQQMAQAAGGQTVQYGDELAGAGIYTIRFSMNFCAPLPDSVNDWANSRVIGFIIHKAASVQPNLANAALFMMPESGEDNLKVKVGNEQGNSGLSEQGLFKVFDKDKVSTQDIAAATQVEEALYGTSFKYKPTPNELVWPKESFSEISGAIGPVVSIFTTFIALASANTCKATTPIGIAVCEAAALGSWGLCLAPAGIGPGTSADKVPILGGAFQQDPIQAAFVCGLSEITIWGQGKFNIPVKYALIAGLGLTALQTVASPHGGPVEEIGETAGEVTGLGTGPALVGSLVFSDFKKTNQVLFNLRSARQESTFMATYRRAIGPYFVGPKSLWVVNGWNSLKAAAISKNIITGTAPIAGDLEKQIIKDASTQHLQEELDMWTRLYGTEFKAAIKAKVPTATNEQLEIIARTYASNAATKSITFDLGGSALPAQTAASAEVQLKQLGIQDDLITAAKDSHFDLIDPSGMKVKGIRYPVGHPKAGQLDPVGVFESDLAAKWKKSPAELLGTAGEDRIEKYASSWTRTVFKNPVWKTEVDAMTKAFAGHAASLLKTKDIRVYNLLRTQMTLRDFKAQLAKNRAFQNAPALQDDIEASVAKELYKEFGGDTALDYKTDAQIDDIVTRGMQSRNAKFLSMAHGKPILQKKLTDGAVAAFRDPSILASTDPAAKVHGIQLDEDAAKIFAEEYYKLVNTKGQIRDGELNTNPIRNSEILKDLRNLLSASAKKRTDPGGGGFVGDSVDTQLRALANEPGFSDLKVLSGGSITDNDLGLADFAARAAHGYNNKFGWKQALPEVGGAGKPDIVELLKGRTIQSALQLEDVYKDPRLAFIDPAVPGVPRTFDFYVLNGEPGANQLGIFRTQANMKSLVQGFGRAEDRLVPANLMPRGRFDEHIKIFGSGATVTGSANPSTDAIKPDGTTQSTEIRDANGKKWTVGENPDKAAPASEKLIAVSEDGKLEKKFASLDEATTALKTGESALRKFGKGLATGIGGGLIGAFIGGDAHLPEAKVNKNSHYIVTYHRVKPWDGLVDTTTINRINGWSNDLIYLRNKCALSATDKLCFELVPSKQAQSIQIGAQSETFMLLAGYENENLPSSGAVKTILKSIVDPDAPILASVGVTGSAGIGSANKIVIK